jgi:hypothetical protein
VAPTIRQILKPPENSLSAASVECVTAEIQYRFLSARPPRSASTVPYLSAGDPSLPRRTREPLDQYPCLRQLAFDWLDRYNEAALDDADAFVTSHEEGVDTEQAAHDLSVYLCNWVVMNSPAAQWFLDPRAGICYVELPGRQSLLDPYHHIGKCLSDRLPVARRFVEQAHHLGA